MPVSLKVTNEIHLTALIPDVAAYCRHGMPYEQREQALYPRILRVRAWPVFPSSSRQQQGARTRALTYSARVTGEEETILE